MSILVVVGTACLPKSEPVGNVSDDNSGSGSGESGESSGTSSAGQSTTGTPSGTSPSTTSTTDTGETTGSTPPECTPDGGTSAFFHVDIEGWPGAEEFEVLYDVECDILSSSSEPALNTYRETVELECDVDGGMYPATLVVTTPPTNAPGPDQPTLELHWALQGQQVRFRYWGVEDAGGFRSGHFLLEEYSLSDVGGGMFTAGARAWDLRDEWYDPVLIGQDEDYCPGAEQEQDHPMLMTFVAPNLTGVDILGGEWGILGGTAPGTNPYFIYVEDATRVEGIGHTDQTYTLVITRVEVSSD